MSRLTLTFDNGPSRQVTPAVLDVLADRGLRATFFVVGEQLARPGGRELAKRAHAEGHWIGNHTMTHSVPFGDTIDAPYLVREIDWTQTMIGELAHADRLFRPFGRGGVLDEHLFSGEAIDHLRHGGYSVVLWNSVPRDWEDTTGWPERVMADLEREDWVVVVVHDLPTGAMDQLPRFLDHLAAEGVDVVQELPDSCVPIRRGQLIGAGALDGLIADPATA
jgi:peptidoglycan/xylan/chitin deacetylase (PgdA/CDA1 family)